MFGYGINQAKGLFFDSPKVLAATSRAERRVLSKFGAFVRTAARSSIRKRQRTSEPGEPPSSHVGLLKKFIFFGYDPQRKSVVIGPARLSAKTGEALPALEYGGPSRIVSGRGRKRRLRTITVSARPFMGPAFEQEQPKLPAMWRDSVK